MKDYASLNKKHWQAKAEWYAALDRECWQRLDPTWGIWRIPETELQLLGDLDWYKDKDIIELGCGTGYWSAWFQKMGASPVGIDVSPDQLRVARKFQQEFDCKFPLIEASAEAVPFKDGSFDLVFSEHGAALWCEPEKWLAEAYRLLRPGGKLIFLTSSPLVVCCTPSDASPAVDKLQRSMFELYQAEYPSKVGVEFHLPHGQMFRQLKQLGFTVDDLYEIQCPEDGASAYNWVSAEWAREWPAEEVWRASK